MRVAERLPSMRLVAALATVAMLLGCRAPVAPSRACQQTSEFGNTGCFEISGTVVGLRGQPLAGIAVGARAPSDRPGIGGGYATTDTAGAFTLRGLRMVGTPPVAGPDTVSLWVVGADPAPAGVNVPARVRDSLLVQVTLTPVGAEPTPVSVRMTLAVP